MYTLHISLNKHEAGERIVLQVPAMWTEQYELQPVRDYSATQERRSPTPFVLDRDYYYPDAETQPSSNSPRRFTYLFYNYIQGNQSPNLDVLQFKKFDEAMWTNKLRSSNCTIALGPTKMRQRWNMNENMGDMMNMLMSTREGYSLSVTVDPSFLHLLNSTTKNRPKNHLSQKVWSQRQITFSFRRSYSQVYLGLQSPENTATGSCPSSFLLISMLIPIILWRTRYIKRHHVME